MPGLLINSAGNEVDFDRDSQERHRKMLIFADLSQITEFTSEQFVTTKDSHLINTYSMNTYDLLHIEHKNGTTIIIKLLYRATSRRQVAL